MLKNLPVLKNLSATPMAPLLAAICLLGGSTAWAQDENLPSSGFNPLNNTYFSLQHEGGDDWGQGTRQTQFGGTKYFNALNDNGVWISYIRLGADNNGHQTGNTGVVRRFWLAENIVGLGGHYDWNRSDYGNDFQQAAVTGEWFTADNNWVVRLEGNLATGQDFQLAQNRGTVVDALYFQGNNLVIDQANVQLFEEAMSGIEYDLSRAFGGQTSEVYVGGYHYYGQIGEDTSGIKGGLRGFLLASLYGNVEIRNDDLFGTNVFGSLTWYFGGPGQNGVQSLQDKLIMPVQRHDQVVVNQVETRTSLAPEILTLGGDAITFTHIDTVNTGGNGDAGTFENPNTSLTSASGSLSDIVYVHSGSTFTGENYTLSTGQRFLGEGGGNEHQLQTDQLGLITLPQVNGLTGDRPIIQNTTNGILANSNTEISNFDINQVNTGLAIVNVFGDVNANRLTMDSNIRIDGGNGDYNFSDVHIVDSSNDGLRLSGGSANVTFDEGSSISVTDGYAVSTQSSHSGNVLFTEDTSITATNTEGFLFLGVEGSYTFNGTNTIDSDSDGGIQLANSDGTYVFGENTHITNTGDGAVLLNLSGVNDIDFTYSGTIENNSGRTISITGGPATGQSIVFNSTAANAIQDTAGGIIISGTDANLNLLAETSLTGTEGIFVGTSNGTHTFSNTEIHLSSGTNPSLEIQSSNGTVNFGENSSITHDVNSAAVLVYDGDTGTLNFDGDLTATNGSGLQFSNADGTYNFNGTNTLHGGNAGIDITNDSSGTFLFSSETSITDPTGIAYNEVNSTANVTYHGTITQNNAATAVRIDNKNGGTTEFNGLVTANTSTANAIDLTYNTGGTIEFNGGLDIDTTTGQGLIANNGGTVNITGTGNSIYTTSAKGVELSEITAGMLFDEITVLSTGVNSGDNAIGLYDVAGDFTVTGTTTIGPDGDFHKAILIENLSPAPDGNITFGEVNIGRGGGFSDLNAHAINIIGGNQTIVFGETTITGAWNLSDLQVQTLGTDGSVTFSRFDNSASTTIRGFFGLNNAGDITIQEGHIRGALGNAVNITQGTGAVYIGADLVNLSNTGNVIYVGDRGVNAEDITFAGDVEGISSGIVLASNQGGDIFFTGDVSESGALGLLIENSSNMSVTFSGENTSFTGNAGMGFTGNDANTSLNFTGGNLTATANTGYALNATGSGSVSIGGTNNQISALSDDAIYLDGITFTMNNTTVSNLPAFYTINSTNSTLSGADNTAGNFSSNDGGGNTGTIEFNGGTDTAP